MAVKKDDFPWLSSYPEGIPYEINPEAFPSLVDLILEGMDNFSSQPAYTYMGKTHTFAEIKEQAIAFAAYLQNNGFKPGDRFAIQMPNCTQYPIALFGSLLAGLVVVNVNPLYTPREMKHQYNDAEVKGAIIVANFANNLEEILSETKVEHVIVTQLGDPLGFPKKHIVNFVVKTVKKMVPAFNLPGSVSFGDVIAKGRSLSYKKPNPNINDLAIIQYTGGTTGVSKGAELSHRNLIANMEGISAWFLPALKHDIPRTILAALPLYHIFALTVNVFSSLKLGYHNILIPNPRDQKALLKDLKANKLFIFVGVNTLFNALINNEDFRNNVDFSNLKVSIAGGMALQATIARQWHEITGCTIAEGYGLSETSPVLTVNPINGGERLGSIGLPFPSTIIKILKEDGTWGEPGEIGEICAWGPQVMKGYYKRPKETEEVFITDEDGKKYFKTGDIGLMEEDGFFKIVDRKKDMILVSGFNVYPNEIEEVISQHPKVLEVACIGVPDPKSTEAVKIFVVKKDDSLTKEELLTFSKDNLTGYKRPKHVEFRDDLPKTNVGKILRKDLREEEMAKHKA